ncbi:transposase [Cellulophaga baltica]|uniref:transposase n=1 Tax=Cellulophaga baltica TaxID=76594 RepID=UPI0031EB6C6F
MTPTIRESGSSVRFRARIRKVGNRKLRNLLFVCSFNTSKHNKACRAVYERIVNKEQRKNVALQNLADPMMKCTFLYCLNK